MNAEAAMILGSMLASNPGGGGGGGGDVTGVKGAAESTYRQGNVNLTAANIGAVPTTDRGVANGVATLDGNGKLASTQLPLGETNATAYAGSAGKANADAIDAIKDGAEINSFGDVETALAEKVDKVTGKGLSTNDYDATAKTKLDGLANVKSIGDGLNLDPTTGELSASGIDVPIDTEMSATSVNPVQNKVITAAMDEKVDKETGKSLIDLSTVVDGATYDSTSHLISFKHGSTQLFTLDAAAFVKDGMVDNVEITGGNLVITFNTDAGKQAISIPLTDIFNPANYYDKTATDGLLANKVSKSATAGLLKNDGTVDTTQYVSDISGKADKITSPTNNNLVAMDANGNIKDSGKNASDFATRVLYRNSATGSGYFKLFETEGTAANQDFVEIIGVIGKYSNANMKSVFHILVDFRAMPIVSIMGFCEKDSIDHADIVAGYNENTSKGEVYFKCVANYHMIDCYIRSSVGTIYQDSSKESSVTLANAVNMSSSASGINGKADKVTSATAGNFASLDANGNIKDSGKKASDFTSVSSTTTDPGAGSTLATNSLLVVYE